MGKEKFLIGFDYFCYGLIGLGYFLFPWKLNQGTAIIGVGLLMWGLKNIRGRIFKDWISDPLVILIISFLLICIFQIKDLPSGWSASVADSISRYYKYIFSIIAIAAMMNSILRNVAMKAFFVSILLIVVSMHLNIFWNLPWSNPTVKGWGNDQTVVGDYITQNLFVNIFVILSMDFLLKNKEIYKKFFFGVAFLAGVHAMLFLSAGRTGYLLLTVSLGVYAIWAIHSKWKWLVVLLLPALVSVAIYSSENASQRVKLAVKETKEAVHSIENNETPDLTSIGARIYMWDQSLSIISKKPLAGWGVGSYPHRWCEKVPEVWCNETAKYHPHNQYLMFWMELGLPGLLIYISIICYLVFRGIQDKKNGGILLALMAILFVDSFINSPLYVRREYQLFLLAIPLIYSFLVKKSEEKNNEFHKN